MRAERLIAHGSMELQGPLLLSPRVFADDRGFFYESWNSEVFRDALESDGQTGFASFVQDNHSRSSAGVLRGLHFQLPPNPQGKLVRCVVGEIFDVAVDLRISSPTFGLWVGARLTAANFKQLWIPEGFAHGFLTLSAQAEVLYKTTDFWSRSCERSIRWDDSELAIAWPVLESGSPSGGPRLSQKDAQAPLLSALPAQELFA